MKEIVREDKRNENILKITQVNMKDKAKIQLSSWSTCRVICDAFYWEIIAQDNGNENAFVVLCRLDGMELFIDVRIPQFTEST